MHKRARPAGSALALAAGLLALGLAGVAGLWVLHGRATPPEARVAAVAAPAPMSGARAERLARRVAAAHADITAVWRHEFRWRHDRSYRPPELVHFARNRPSPCAGAAGVSGPFYCPADRTLSLDLAFLERLSARMRAEGGRAVVLVVARIAAEHVQAELAILGDADRRRPHLTRAEAGALDRDIVLQADCIAGVWARRAAGRLGAVEAGGWGRIVAAARLVAPEAAAAARLDVAAVAAREAAFARGQVGGALQDCLGPGLEGVLG